MPNLKTLLFLEIKRQMFTYSKKGKALEVLLYILLLFSSLWMGSLVPLLSIVNGINSGQDTGASFSNFIKTGVSENIFDFFGLVVFLMGFIAGFFMMKMIYFNKFDHDTLWVLPIKKREIFLSKFLGLLIPYLLPILLFSLPTAFIGYLKIKNILYCILFLLGAYAIIILSLSIGMLLRLLLLRIFPYESLPKWAKSLLALLFMSVFLFIYFWQVSSGFSYIGKAYRDYEDFLVFFQILSPIFQGRILPLIFILLVSAASNFCLYLILEKFYFYFLSIGRSRHKESRLKESDYKVTRPILALIKKEISLYWSNSAVVSNTFVSVFILLFFAGAAFLPSVQGSIATLLEDYKYFTKDTFLFFLLIFLAGMMNISTFNFSLENRMAYNTYSLPLKGQKIFLGKLLASLVQIVPVYLSSFLLLLLSFKPSPSYIPLLLWGPLAYIAFNNSVGLFFDLKFANYLWDDPKQLAKQSKQAFFTGIGNLVLSMFIFLLGYQVLAYYPYLFCLLTSLILIFSNMIFYFLLKDIKVFHI